MCIIKQRENFQNEKVTASYRSDNEMTGIYMLLQHIFGLCTKEPTLQNGESY